jgi:hypothetical protein
MKKQAFIRIFFSAAAVISALSFMPTPAHADCTCGDGRVQPFNCSVDSDCVAPCSSHNGSGRCTAAATQGSVSTGSASGQTKSLENPLGSVCNGATGQKCVQIVIGNVIRAALGVSGSIALLMITWGGFLWLTSMGNSERVERGKNTVIWSTLGLVLIFGAYAITSYIVNSIASGGK